MNDVIRITLTDDQRQLAPVLDACRETTEIEGDLGVCRTSTRGYNSCSLDRPSCRRVTRGDNSCK